MKKILKSILIATASIGTIAGSTAAVISCGENKNENQDKYNTALTTLKGKLGIEGSTILEHFHVQQGTSDFTNVQNAIQTRIDGIINADASIKDILGAVTIKAPASSFVVGTAGTDVKIANNITMDVASDLANVTLPASSNISIKYTVVSEAQASYDDSVNTIMAAINANAVESRNTFAAGSTPGTSAESQSEILTYLYNLINNAIPVADKSVNRFTQESQIPGLVATAAAIHAEILKGAATGKTIIITAITFASKIGGLTTDPQSFTFNYSIAASPQKLYDAQMAALISKFTTTDAGSIITQITNGSNNADAITKIQDAVKAEITKNPSSYTILNGTTTTVSGLKENAFANVPVAGANTPSNTLTQGVKITITPKDDTNVHPTAGGYAFAFQYTVGASATDRTAYEAALSTIGTHFDDVANVINLTYNANTTGTTWTVAVKTAILTAITTYLKATPAVGSLIDSSKINIQISGNSFVNNYTQGAVANKTQVTVSFPSVWGSITPASQAPAFFFYYKVPASTDQLQYQIEAQEILTTLSTYTQTNPIILHKGDNALKAKTVIATSINAFIASQLPMFKTKIGVIPLNAMDTAITGDIPNTASVADAASHELSITIPTIAQSGVTVKPLTEGLTIQVVDTSTPDQAAYDTAFQKVLSGVPASNSSFFNWYATKPASGNTPPPASDHWLGGLGFSTYDKPTFLSTMANGLDALLRSAAPMFGALLSDNTTVLGEMAAKVAFLAPDGTSSGSFRMDLSQPGIHNFQLEFQFAGTGTGLTLHTIILGFTITITQG